MKHNWKRVLSVVLTVALLSAFLVPMASATNDREAASRQESLELTPIDASTLDLFQGNAAPEEAIEQIRSRNYAASVEGLGSDPLLVAITYDKDDKTKPHHCRIERYKG